jgi:phenylalanine-4-hydroxylase
MQQLKSNPLLDRLPKHLKQFIKAQDYNDDAYQSGSVALCDVCRLPSQVAHSSLLDGLKKTEQS